MNAAQFDAFKAFIAPVKLKFFQAFELVATAGNIKNGVKNTFPPEKLWPNIVPTIKIVDQLRKRIGAPLKINSAYRSPAYNTAIKGATKSQHMRFAALDIRSTDPKWTPKKIHAELKAMRAAGMFKGGLGLYPTFVHVDTRGVNTDWA